MKMNRYIRQSGASMIEVIVTIIVVAVGLLGVASLQANTMRFLKVANLRADATQSAYEITERMRANGGGITDPVTKLPSAAYSYLTPYATTVSSPPVASNACNGTCIPADIAKKDVAEWQATLAQRMYGGAGYINPVDAGVYDITVMWKEVGFTTVDPACPSSTPPAPGAGVRCFTVRFIP